ncbi:GAF domain-containing sensor histidine kinase [bacterium]|nr:GAF domain-containing sensor histidine kinase [bacterium]MBT4292311.1 GAF domain-containing sensor histidine kinase [bacterium]MBT7310162.1 GAF domain-containing sensor histidine kinase [bacterium]
MARDTIKQQLKKHMEFEELVKHVFSGFINLDNSEIDNEINHALETIGSFAEVDRSYVFSADEENRLISNTHEWCAEGVTPEIDKLQNLPAASAPYCTKQLFNHKIVLIKSVKDLPPEAQVDREMLEHQGIKSLVLVPMTIDAKMTGFIGFDWVKNKIVWDETHIPLLRIVGDIIAQAYQRNKSSKQLNDYQEKLRSLASELSLTEERERRKLASDLHDHVSQSLSIAKIRLGILRNEIGDDNTAPVSEIIDLVGQSIADIRTLTFELSPPVLYDLGLVPALQWLGEQMGKKYGFQVDVTDDLEDKLVNENLKIELFKIARELLMNVAKHANASLVQIDVKRIKETIVLTVTDNGIGILSEEERENPKGGFGLFSIKERLKHLGGTFVIDRGSECGTQAVLHAPLSLPNKAKGII